MRKKKSGLYTYLDAIKVFDWGTEEDIAAAKKEYRRQYKTAWRQSQRKSTKQYTVSLTEAEQITIRQSAQRHKRSITAFIKVACIAYVRQQFVVPDTVALHAIQELLDLNYGYLKDMFNERTVPYQQATALLERQAVLEAAIMQQLTSPKNLEQCIADAIRSDNGYINTIMIIIQKYSR